MRGDWARYWRAEGQPLEAMHAHFRSHVYHRHSHDTYSFGVTETGAQAFACRGGKHVSAPGMVMTFNPDDPHDGHAATEPGFADQAHLTRWFRRCYGVTPGAYRSACG